MRNWVYWADVAVIPILAGAMARWVSFEWRSVPLFVAGLGGWTLMEYWIHRAMHHRTLFKYHLPHHREPEAGSALGTISSILAALFVTALGYLWRDAIPFLQGLMVGYVWFVIVHATTHHRSMSRHLTAAHEVHHRNGRANFGVTTTFWDRVHATFSGR